MAIIVGELFLWKIKFCLWNTNEGEINRWSLLSRAKNKGKVHEDFTITEKVLLGAFNVFVKSSRTSVSLLLLELCDVGIMGDWWFDWIVTVHNKYVNKFFTIYYCLLLVCPIRAIHFRIVHTDLVLKLILLRAPILRELASVNSLLWRSITRQIRYNLDTRILLHHHHHTVL